jgi:23S rRNA (adenine2503-C2)-methyltransferase
MRDGRRIESVLMAEDDRRTVCISTQVGCGMGCVFCASGLKGVERNLSRGEIVEQVLRLRNLLPAEESVTNLVVMGMGESLANFDNLVAALDRLCSPDGLGLGQRRVTISTVGLPEKMVKLADWTGSITWPSRCTRRPRRCGTSWCRSTRRWGSGR